MLLNIVEVPAHPEMYTRGRGGQAPRAIVIHRMAGSLRGTDAWFQTSRAGRNGSPSSSAHYGIGQNGEIHRYVAESNAAFHAGALGTIAMQQRFPWIVPGLPLNWQTIGIEHEGKGDEPWSNLMVAVSAALIADIARRYKIEILPATVLRHSDVRATACPGPVCPMDRLTRNARALAQAGRE